MIYTFVRLVQPRNAKFPMLVTPSGTVMAFRSTSIRLPEPETTVLMVPVLMEAEIGVMFLQAKEC